MSAHVLVDFGFEAGLLEVLTLWRAAGRPHESSGWHTKNGFTELLLRADSGSKSVQIVGSSEMLYSSEEPLFMHTVAWNEKRKGK